MTNLMLSNDLEAYGKKCCIFCSISKSDFDMLLKCLLTKSFCNFNAICFKLEIYAVKCLVNIYIL